MPALSTVGRADLSGFLKTSVERGDIPGVVALVTSPDAEMYLEAFGFADVAARRPLERDAIFRIASMTKPVTTLAAMMLYEQGELELDAPVVRYLPDYRQPPIVDAFDAATGRVNTHPAEAPITIRHLLTHTSGMAYSFDDPVLAALEKAGTKDDDFPLVHEPGARWTYGPNTLLLGRVVERLTGDPLDVVFRTRIFEPLGMQDTSYRVPDDKRARVVKAYQRSSGTLTELPASPAAGAVRGDAGLASTAHDYGIFVRMLLNGGRSGAVRLAAPATVEAMRTNQIGALRVRRMAATMPSIALSFPVGADHDTFGFGFQIAAPGTSVRSAGSYSWAGVFNTYFWVDPIRRIGAVLLMQVLPFFDEKCAHVAGGFEDRVYRALQ